MIVHVIQFALLCALLIVLPLLPALLEWRLKRDAQPLRVVRAYDGNIKHFASGFRQFLRQRMPGLMGSREASGEPLDPGTFQLVAAGAGARFQHEEVLGRSTQRMVLSAGDLALGEGMLYEKELYCAAALVAGERNSFRAILAVGDLTLGGDCAVFRWAHSDACISIGPRARLYGRISAEGQIALQAGTRFGRMAAPLIRFGMAEPMLPRLPSGGAALALPGDILDQSDSRWLVAGPLEVPAHARHEGNLVSRKHASVGASCHLLGDIKSNGDLAIASDVIITGAVVATGTLVIGARCHIAGPIVCDGQIVIGHGSVIGSPEQPTTVTAAEIRIDEGVLAYGTVWAREVGVVTSAQAARP